MNLPSKTPGSWYWSLAKFVLLYSPGSFWCYRATLGPGRQGCGLAEAAKSSCQPSRWVEARSSRAGASQASYFPVPVIPHCLSSALILAFLVSKRCFCFVSRTFLCREFEVGVGISTDETIITEHRLSAQRQAGNVISTHMPQAPCWLYRWAGSLGVQGQHRGGLLARAAKRRGYVACKTTLVEVGSPLSGKSKAEAWLLWNLQGERGTYPSIALLSGPGSR